MNVICTQYKLTLSDYYNVSLLFSVQACIEQRLAVSEPLSPLCNDGFLVDAFNMYLKLSVILEVMS